MTHLSSKTFLDSSQNLDLLDNLPVYTDHLPSDQTSFSFITEIEMVD